MNFCHKTLGAKQPCSSIQIRYFVTQNHVAEYNTIKTTGKRKWTYRNGTGWKTTTLKTTLEIKQQKDKN